MALGIEPPWVVTKSDFDATTKRLDIHLDFARGNRFACPQCGIAGCPTYDSEDKTWRHLNFFQHEAYLHARVSRVTCKGCGIKQVSVPWRGRIAALRYCSKPWSWPWCKRCRWPLSREWSTSGTPGCGGSSTTTSRRLGTAPIIPRSPASPSTRWLRGVA